MTTQLFCLLGGILLPYIWAGASVPFRIKQKDKVDLVQPRVQGESLVDGGAWVVGAQMNAWEALIVFTVANFSAFAAGVDPAGSWSIACIVWLVARTAHGIMYVAGQVNLRVLCFLVGLASSLFILVQALRA